MAKVIIGSARHDERNKYLGGAAGDQLQKGTDDYKGEVSMQDFYVHSKGWVILRPKNSAHASQIAKNMITACNNPNIGYDQNERLGVIKSGINTSVKTECDCSSLVRACVKEATGKDPGNFTTGDEASKLVATGLFTKIIFTSLSATPLHEGDILVTKTKGHTVIVVSGQNASPSEYYPVCNSKYTSIVDALGSVGEKNTSLANRKRIASANEIKNYTGTAAQNAQMLALLKAGKLKRA